MTNDIVTWLRLLSSCDDDWVYTCAREAADEIEQLRARVCLLEGYLNGALDTIEKFVACDTADARAALAKETNK